MVQQAQETKFRLAKKFEVEKFHVGGCDVGVGPQDNVIVAVHALEEGVQVGACEFHGGAIAQFVQVVVFEQIRARVVDGVVDVEHE